MTDNLETKLLANEHWWSGNIAEGHLMPHKKGYQINQSGNNLGNQSVPFLISTKGRYIWSESPLEIHFTEDFIHVQSKNKDITFHESSSNIREAYEVASATHFKPTGEIPEEMMFTLPQYNTWIELTYNQTEENILTYAQSIIDQGYPPGVLMIDDNWQEDYGVWEFSGTRFKNPKSMIKKLHDLGFKVMLWVCPFVSPDSFIYRDLAKRGLLIMDESLEEKVLWANTSNFPSIVRWWNGASGVIDLSNPEGLAWFHNALKKLQEEYKVDGFKFDAGDARFYRDPNMISHNTETSSNDHMELFASLGREYKLNELRASWKLAGEPIAQRLRDKKHNWEDLQLLIPHMITMSNMGYAYTCPDMIGGGEYQSFKNIEDVDQELIVRSAQASALMPMMQFSVAPWRVLNDENASICLEMAKLHTEFGIQILDLAKSASETGLPILRSMEFNFPGKGYENILDQFMIGENLIVAPVLQKGAISRVVQIPEGTWKDIHGQSFVGPQSIKESVSLGDLPHFTRVA